MEARVFHHQSPARWQRRNKAEEEQRRKKRLEVQIISAQKLAKVHMLKKTKAYAVAWMDMHQDAKLSTDVDRRGGRNPSWNKVLSFSAAEAEQLVETLGTNAALNIEIYSKSWLRDKLVGTVRVLLVDLLQGIPDKGKCFTFMVVRPSGRRKGLLNVGVRPEKAFYDDELVLYTGATSASATAAASAAGAATVAASAPVTDADPAADADSAAAVQQVAADSHRIAARLQQLHVEMDLSRTNASRPAAEPIASGDHRQQEPSAGTVQRVDSHQIATRLQHANSAPDSIVSRDHREQAPPSAQRVEADSHRIAARLQQLHGEMGLSRTAHTNASRPGDRRQRAPSAGTVQRVAADSHLQRTNAYLPAPDSIASQGHREHAQGGSADSHRIAARLQQLHGEMDLHRTARTKASRPVVDSTASRIHLEHAPSAPPLHGYVD